ncbi:SAM-dependent methyltransferase [Vandammella animalimorsus]|uniref:SAM-dependent methyltransferase n=2 Tax=Vandammella animalimorsus TaxID=2029117 RepID=A0A2A2T8P8_9BURK|nr:SAM-dependent methyltransferase [Vandammella animalimorsus]PAX18569.1 SAM-dependent methyltransferase [Vandammella animalimorsus]PAX20732.1 SAM-dependent methyltransferase [Vandammella animalimorsus]
MTSKPAPSPAPRQPGARRRPAPQAQQDRRARQDAAAQGQAALAELGLPAGASIELLQALHILTREGRLNQDSRRKLKQVLHLVQFIEPLIHDIDRQRGAQSAESADGTVDAGPVLVDHGAGKSYLGFILYDLVLRPLGRGRVIGVEWRPALVAQSQALAQRQGFARMDFLPMAVADAQQHPGLPARVDIVTALHACDTATDDAIAFGLAKQAQAMVLVPCCQAEVAAHLRRNKALQLARTPLAELWRHPLHTRELGSHVTNVMRCLYLQACGYQVTVTELTGWEHSLKNELIIARWTGQRQRSARERLHAMAEQLGLQQWLQQRFALPAPTQEKP